MLIRVGRAESAIVALAMIGSGCATAQSAPACCSERVPAFLPIIIRAAEADARSGALTPEPGDRLYIDVHSFTNAVFQLTGQEIVSDDVRAAVGRPSEDLQERAATRCSATSCWVLEDGIYVELDSLFIGGDTISAFTTSFTTHRRTRKSSALHRQEMKYLLIREPGDNWQIGEKELLLAS